MNAKRIIRLVGVGIVHILVLGLLLLTFSLRWAKGNFANIGFEEIVFHLNMPLKGTADNMIGGYLKAAFLPAILLFAGYLIVIFWPTKYLYRLEINRKWIIQLFPIHMKVIPVVLVGSIWITALVKDADTAFGFLDYMANQIQQSKVIEGEYVSPDEVSIRFPEQKRNLICIYIESAETSAQDRENGGGFSENYIPEMTQIAKDNISFSQSDLIEGATVVPGCGWTIAGLVAETSGLPLKLYKPIDPEKSAGNSMDDYASFMPGAVTLGDLLEREGYHNYFMAGSDFEFGGRTNYFTQHGAYDIWDYYTAKSEKKIPEDYDEWWGFEDQKLYEFAKEKLLEISKQDEPFNFSMLTADTHHEDGYLCKLCQNIYPGQYENVLRCASKQLDEFVKWITEQDFYENTTIAIMGDHCSMDSDFYEGFPEESYGGTVRKVYNAFVNAAAEPSREKNRKFTTLDMFPSILASMGVEIEGNRLGLGTNLFSGEETLAEEYGYAYLLQELSKKSSFYNQKILFP